MVFTEWLELQRYRRDLVGELSEQLHLRTWPHTDNFQALKVRLSLERASSLSFKALSLAFEEWQLSRSLPLMTVFPTKSLPLN
jgi:hypothetical protein